MRAHRPRHPRHPVVSRRLPLKAKPQKRSRFWVYPWVVFFTLCFIAGALGYREMQTSALQAHWFSSYDKQIAFTMEPGPNEHMRYPKAGPYNERLGYTYLPFYTKTLLAGDFSVAEQTRASKAYSDLLRRGIYPIYHPKAAAGLSLFDNSGEEIYSASYPNHIFQSFESIPPLLVNTLLFVENRELLEAGPVTRNPVIEWNRLFAAILGQLTGQNEGGGSTLATQIEKFRFSPQGKTGSALEKLRQLASGSFRVYLDGSDTREARKKIVLDYLNNTPLLARPGFGEINSIGDGLWAWFGIELNDAAAALNGDEKNPDSLAKKALAYRSALGLILAQRRPTYYLQSNRGALDELINATLDRLHYAGVISRPLRDAAQEAKLEFLKEVPDFPEPPYIEQKAVNAFRTHLMNLLGLKNLYEVDRLDLTGHTTLLREAQAKLVDFLKHMSEREFLQQNGLYGFRLLKPENDPAKIKWSVVLYERGEHSNKLRLQADNIDGPFDMNEGMKLDLGSTAKLRTLVTYLEIIAELHRRYAGLDVDDLADLKEEAPDRLTDWALEYLSAHPEANLEDMLRASLDRKYSANPGEVFFTGSGAHTFHNFEKEEDSRIMDLHEAFRHSVNLVFIRLMRDIVNYTIAQEPLTKDELLGDDENPARQEYLERFADEEGRVYLNRYISDLSDLTQNQRIDKLLAHAHKGAVARTVVFRSLVPSADFDSYVAFMKSLPSTTPVPEGRLRKLYDAYAINKFSLEDRAYLSGVNPMELWLVAYWHQNPKATPHQLLEASRPVRIESYAWLYKASTRAQNTRIRIIMEEDAFARIQKRWKRVGYPFDRLVPSFATAIGSSADRPGALAELVGIILNDGKKLPVQRFDTLEFGKNTPYQTLFKLDPDRQSQELLAPEICRVMKEVMTEVVQNGTAQRLKGVFKDTEGNEIPVGGKTGTGDHRYEEFGAGGRLISSRVVNRTGTFVFYIGDRFFGTITAHVAGEDAESYVFTSALSAQMLKALAPILNPVVSAAMPAKPVEAAEQPKLTEIIDSPKPEEVPSKSEALLPPKPVNGKVAPRDEDDTTEISEP